MEHELRLVAPKSFLDLLGHPIESGGELLLIFARHPDAGALWDFGLNRRRAVGRVQGKYGSNNVLFVFHVTRSSETEHTRYGVTPPVFGEGTIGKILLEHFYGRFPIYLVDDVSLGACHRPFATYREITDADGRGWLRLTRE